MPAPANYDEEDAARLRLPLSLRLPMTILRGCVGVEEDPEHVEAYRDLLGKLVELEGEGVAMKSDNNNADAPTVVRLDLVEMLRDLASRMSTAPGNDAALITAAVDYIGTLEGRADGGELREVLTRLRQLNHELVEMVREKSRTLSKVARESAKLAKANARMAREVVAARSSTSSRPTTPMLVAAPRRLDERHFELDDGLDAQWFAWGVFDGASGGRRTGPERDGCESDLSLELRRRSYGAGIAAGEALR